MTAETSGKLPDVTSAAPPLRRQPTAAGGLVALSRRLRLPLAAAALTLLAALLMAAWEGRGVGFAIAAGLAMATSGFVALCVMCCVAAVLCWRAAARFWFAVRPPPSEDGKDAGRVFTGAVVASLAAAAILLGGLYTTSVQESIGVIGIVAACFAVALVAAAVPFAAAVMVARRRNPRSNSPGSG